MQVVVAGALTPEWPQWGRLQHDLLQFSVSNTWLAGISPEDALLENAATPFESVGNHEQPNAS